MFLLNINGKNKENIDCYYKRYTPIVHKKARENSEVFYKVNDKNEFLAFKHEKSFCGGFCRDLFFDHLRCQHNKGMLSGINPQDLGLTHWKADVLYEGVFDNYKEKIKDTLKKYKRFEKFLN